MSIIPNDLYKRGRQTCCIERVASFLNPGAYADIIASDVGKAAALTCDQYKFTGVSSAAPTCGFTTKTFKMYDDTQGDCVIAAELQMDGVMHPNTCYEKVIFSDGANSITVYNDDNTVAGDTKYTATIDGVTTGGIMLHCFNLGANYSGSRTNSTSVDEYVRLNLRYRFDKNRNEFSVWLNDQIKGAVHFDHMTSFGDCTFQYIHQNFYSGLKPVYVKQIGLRLEC